MYYDVKKHLKSKLLLVGTGLVVFTVYQLVAQAKLNSRASEEFQKITNNGLHRYKKYGIEYYYAKNIVKFAQSKFAASTTIKDEDENHDYDYRGIIMIDDYFQLLDAFGVEFTLNHELGHIALKHHSDVIPTPYERKKTSLFGDVSKLELDADHYAAERIGYDKAILGLLNMKEVLESNVIDKLNYRLAIKEIDRRIEALRHHSLGDSIFDV